MIDPAFMDYRDMRPPCEWKDSSIPATNALERLACMPRREWTRRSEQGRKLQNSACMPSLANKTWSTPTGMETSVMTEICHASLSIEAFIDFPHISWVPDLEDERPFPLSASKRSVSYSDALLAPLHSTLISSWSTSSLGGKRKRMRTSKKPSSQQHCGMVRSIAMDAELSSLLTVSLPQSILDTTEIRPIRTMDDLGPRSTSSSMDYPYLQHNTTATVHITPTLAHITNIRNVGMLNEYLRPRQDSEMDNRSPFLPRNPTSLINDDPKYSISCPNDTKDDS